MEKLQSTSALRKRITLQVELDEESRKYDKRIAETDEALKERGKI